MTDEPQMRCQITIDFKVGQDDEAKAICDEIGELLIDCHNSIGFLIMGSVPDCDMPMTAERTNLLIGAIVALARCDKAIAQYAEHGISGTPHDLEHRQMREDAWKLFKKLTSS